MDSGPRALGWRQRADEGDQLGAKRSEPAERVIGGERGPGRPLGILLGAVAAERRPVLGQEAPEAVQEYRVVARQMGEVLPRRPFLGAGSRLERGGVARARMKASASSCDVRRAKSEAETTASASPRPLSSRGEPRRA